MKKEEVIVESSYLEGRSRATVQVITHKHTAY
jgi:hypothetical protein